MTNYSLLELALPLRDEVRFMVATSSSPRTSPVCVWLSLSDSPYVRAGPSVSPTQSRAAVRGND